MNKSSMNAGLLLLANTNNVCLCTIWETIFQESIFQNYNVFHSRSNWDLGIKTTLFFPYFFSDKLAQQIGTSLPLPAAKGRRRAHSQTTSHPKPFHKKSREHKQKPMARRGKGQKNIQKESQSHRNAVSQSSMSGSTCLLSSPPMTHFAQCCLWRVSHPPRAVPG